MSAEPAELAELRRRAREISDLNGIGGLLLWDQNTMMPPGGAGARADQFEALERIQHDRLTDPGLGEAARRARAVGGIGRSGLRRREPHPRPAPRPPQGGPGPDRAGGRDLQRRRARPAGLAGGAREGRLRALRAGAGARARAAGPLHRVLRRHGRVRAPVRHPARRLRARPHDRGAAGHLRALAGASSSRSSPPPRRPARTATCSRGTSRVEAQQRMADELLHAVGFETEHWRLDPSVHPFARSMAATDVRLTTRWEEDDLAMAFYSCLHEFGHGLYEAQFEPRHYRTTLAEATGLGVHESQIAAVGEPRRPLAAVLRVGAAAAAAEPRRAVRGEDAAAMYRAVNQVRLSLIRIEADETTYNLHIALRFELELAMVEGRLAVADLPDAWDEATHRLLGLETPSVMEGVLQDIHWGAGMIGYFPTYTIGNLMAAAAVAGAGRRSARHRRPDRGRRLRPVARVAAREHPPPRPQVRLARAAPAGDGGGAQRRAVAGLSRGQAAGCRIADRSGAGSPLVANVCSTKPSGRRHRMEGGLMSSRQNSIVVTGAREHNLKDVTVSLPRDSLVVITGLSGSGKSSLAFDTIYAEGPAPVRRVAERVRAPVPGADGQAGRGLDRGALAGDLDRPEDHVAQPAVDGRHGHGDLRLPAPAVGADRQAALLQLRAADRRAVGGADHRPDHGHGGGHPLHGHGADRARAQGRVRQAAAGAAVRGLHAREGGRRAAARWKRTSSSTRSTSTTSRWSWTGW